MSENKCRLGQFFLIYLFVIAPANQTQAKEETDWNQSEYNSTRSTKNLKTAFSSKAFSWLSGSPADNEKLSVGKNAQFFGFVALRKESGRSANRGALGRAFYSISTKEQRSIIHKAATDEAPLIAQWWEVRRQMLRMLETHLYNGSAIDEIFFRQLSIEFGKINGQIVLIEAKAYASLEDSLTSEQKTLIRNWRKDPEQAFYHPSLKKIETRVSTLSEEDSIKKITDLYGKSFAWITGTPEDTEIIPLGQPAQFFGFVSIRHKSGRGAKRGKISKQFRALLSPQQEDYLNNAVNESAASDQQFFQTRRKILQELLLLRNAPNTFNQQAYNNLNKQLGDIEATAALIQARAYQNVRASMTEQQINGMMAIRNDYIVDPKQVQTDSIIERGENLALLCSGCHDLSGTNNNNKIAPTLKNISGRKIASINGFDYSNALTNLRQENLDWNETRLNEYLQSPKAFAPGTKMEFQGLIREEDRSALIEYLKRL